MPKTIIKIEMELTGDYADLVPWLENCPHADLIKTEVT